MLRLALHQLIKKRTWQNGGVTRKGVNQIIFKLSCQKFRWQSFVKIERLSQELFMSEFQYQNSSIWWCYQWLRLNLLKPRSFLGIMPKVSQTKFYQIRIAKSKVIHVQIPVSKWEKTKKWKKISGLRKRGNKGITNWGKRNYK